VQEIAKHGLMMFLIWQKNCILEVKIARLVFKSKSTRRGVSPDEGISLITYLFQNSITYT
jgi:hypothetical protein